MQTQPLKPPGPPLQQRPQSRARTPKVARKKCIWRQSSTWPWVMQVRPLTLWTMHMHRALVDADRVAQWQRYRSDLAERYPRHRALHQELEIAGL